MKTHNSILLVLVTVFTICGTSLAQQPNSKNEETGASRGNGLRKVASGTGEDEIMQALEIDLNEIERSVEVAVETAMSAVDVSIDDLDVRLESLEFLGNEFTVPEIEIDPVEIDVPEIQIDVEGLYMVEQVEANFDEPEAGDWNEDSDRISKTKAIRGKKEKSDKIDKKQSKAKEKTKGLKKLN